MSFLTVDRVTAAYVPGINILENVSIAARERKVTGIVGLNGAGKSTLFKTICGFVQPSQGSISLGGRDISAIQPHKTIHEGMWMIPQENGLFPQLSVEENMIIPLGRKFSDRNQVRSQLEKAFDAFPEIAEKRKSNAGDLSGGQQKIVEIAKAYALSPKVLLIDEPSIGLSPRYAEVAYSWINRLVDDGATAILIDHHVQRVINTSAYVYVLGIGTIVDEGEPDSFGADMAALMKKWMGLEAQDA